MAGSSFYLMLGMLALGSVVACGNVTDDPLGAPPGPESGGLPSAGGTAGGIGAGGTGAQSTATGGGEVGGDSGAAEPETTAFQGELTISVGPKEIADQLYWLGVPLAEEANHAFEPGELTFAFGREYPTQVELSISTLWIGGLESTCVVNANSGWVFSAADFEFDPELLDIRVLDEETLLLELKKPGTQDVTLRGAIDTDPASAQGCSGTTVPFSSTVTIRVLAPSDSAIVHPKYCEEAPTYLAGPYPIGSAVTLLDPDGRAWSPTNAVPERTVEVTLVGGADTSFDVPAGAGLQNVAISGQTGEVLLETRHGAKERVAVVSPGAVTGIDIFLEVWAGRYGFMIPQDNAVQADLDEVLSTSISLHARAGAAVVCNPLDPSLIDLSMVSTTPQVCRDDPDLGGLVVEGYGTCALEFHTADLGGEAGLSTTVSFPVQAPER